MYYYDTSAINGNTTYTLDKSYYSSLSNNDFILECKSKLLKDSSQKAFVLNYTDNNKKTIDYANFKSSISNAYLKPNTSSGQQIFAINNLDTITDAMLSNPINYDSTNEKPTQSQIVNQLYEVDSTSKFYTRINGIDYNIDSIMRVTDNTSSSKDKFIHDNNLYFSGDSNNSSDIYDTTLIDFNTYSIDYMNNTKFKHDTGSGGRPDLGNYFGAKYDDFYSTDTRHKPSWCNRIICICVGAGGSGGAAGFGDNDGQGGGGGGSGAAIVGYMDLDDSDTTINITVGIGGHPNNYEHANGNPGSATTISVNNKKITAGPGAEGQAYNPGGVGGTTEYSTSVEIIREQNGKQGSWGANADDDDDEMSSDWQGYRAPGGGSVYIWTKTGYNYGYGGAGGHFGNDDGFDGDYGSSGYNGFARIYYIRQ